MRLLGNFMLINYHILSNINITIRSGNINIPIVVRNPLTTTINVKIANEAQIAIPAGRSAHSTQTVFHGKIFHVYSNSFVYLFFI